jgi:hypothetical protein
MAAIPTLADEDAKRPNRERESLGRAQVFEVVGRLLELWIEVANGSIGGFTSAPMDATDRLTICRPIQLPRRIPHSICRPPPAGPVDFGFVPERDISDVIAACDGIAGSWCSGPC